MNRLGLALVAVLAAVALAHAQLMMTGFGEGVGGTGGAPLTPCGAGQLDFSVATGCNTTQYMVILK